MMGTPLQRKLYRCAMAMNLPLCSEWDAVSEGILIGTGRGDLREWNPHRNDLDAFHLTVALGVALIFEESTKTVYAAWGGKERCASLKGGRARAVRRAVVEVVVASA